MEYKIEDLTKEEAAYIGAAINEIVPHEVDADDAKLIENGIQRYSEAYEPEYERVDYDKKLTDEEGRFAAGLIAEAEKVAKENGSSMILTNAGDWNVEFFKKNGYLLRGELKDVPKGHNCYELYKMI